jgi:hypothetical protein
MALSIPNGSPSTTSITKKKIVMRDITRVLNQEEEKCRFHGELFNRCS